MIKAIIFDLDGTLIQTEILKAESYARAIHTLSNEAVAIQSVLDRFKKYVGLSRPEVAAGLVRDFKQELAKHFDKDGDESMEDWMLNKRLSIYHDMLNDGDLLSNYFCNHNLKLLHEVSQAGKFKVVLATMSHPAEASKVLQYLGVKDKLDLILTRDNVSEGKPNPEIYLQAMTTINVEADECLVLEDSVNGIKAGINAKMNVFAVTNSITHESVIGANLLAKEYIIEDPKHLCERVHNFIDSKSDS